MKKVILSITVFTISLIFFSCGEKKEEIKAPEGMRITNLSSYGKPIILFVPDSTQGKLEITEQPGGILEIKVGRQFDILVKEGEEDIAFKKADLGNDDVYKIKQFIVDEPNSIAWEWAIGDLPSEFHFISVQKVGNSAYTFEDNRNSDGAPFSRSAIEKMLDAVKNIKQATKKEE
ncbi:MAG: hypothetical protein N2203_01680 [Bacteroidia bacterium]|nr:hypothetical protein [Bacteroidia bacterium]